ncbi:uncharacterized protein LOC133866209 [Alnus glutinosa]|uniref:uncharacterized protein LOC133866209 n=1 Tax=Alnus glutinosa TaxID=3517 RepID=UPI002D77BEA4|nr:uncharacterized protein LOC133866209 [Alnus glutinosa]
MNQGGGPHQAHNQYPPGFHHPVHHHSCQAPPALAYQPPTQAQASSSQSTLEDTLKAFMQLTGQSINEVKNATMVNTQAIAKIEVQIVQIVNHLDEREKGKLPSQPVPNPKLQCTSESSYAHRQEHVQAIVTLRSGRQVDNQVVLHEENPAKPHGRDSGNNEETEEEPSKATPIVDDPPRSLLPQAPYPERLLAPKKGGKFEDILEVKRITNVPKRVCLTEQVSSILQCKMPLKYKDPGCPTISCMIGLSQIERALLDLGASVNLLPYSVYLQLGLGELKPTSMTIQLANRSVKRPRGIIEDVLVKVDKFYFPVDFVVLDTEPVQNIGIQIPIILGRPFLAMANALINCRTGVMKISFGNMTVELNIFDIRNQPLKYDEIESVCLIEEIKEDIEDKSSIKDPLEACLVQFGEDLNLDKLLEQADVLLESTPLDLLEACFAQSGKDLDKLLEQADAILESAPLVSSENEKAAIHEPPKKGLTPLQDIVKYKFLGPEDVLPVSNALDLLDAPVEKLPDVLREHMKDNGWTIDDSKWLSPIHDMPKRAGLTVVENKDDEFVPTRIQSGWRTRKDYRKVHVAKRKAYFSHPFIDPML